MLSIFLILRIVALHLLVKICPKPTQEWSIEHRFMISPRGRTKFWQHNPAVVQLYAQIWCSGEQQGYAAETSLRPRASS